MLKFQTISLKIIVAQGCVIQNAKTLSKTSRIMIADPFEMKSDVGFTGKRRKSAKDGRLRFDLKSMPGGIMDSFLSVASRGCSSVRGGPNLWYHLPHLLLARFGR
jgi:hypothetical protein